MVKDKAGKTVYAAGFAFDTLDGEDRVALICKARPRWMLGLLNGVGGHVEEDETPIEAMAREFEEETGQATLEADWREFAVVVTDKSRVHMFAARLGALTVADKTDEHVYVIRVHDLPVWATVPNLAWLVPMALRAEDIVEPAVVRERAKYERPGEGE